MTEPKIVKVEPTVPMISLTWMLGSRCNYDCQYCPSDLHDMTSAHPDLEKLKLTWQIFYEKTKHIGLPYKISFTGGEVTANKSFLPLIEYLNSGEFDLGQILVSTNGSASLGYYQKLAAQVHAISFSVHSEFFNEQEFFDKVEKINGIMIRPERSVHVNIMYEFWNLDRIPVYELWLKDKNISYSINQIDYSYQTRVQPTLQGVYNLEPV